MMTHNDLIDLSLHDGVTADDLALAGGVVVAPLPEWHRLLSLDFAHVGNTWELVIELEDGHWRAHDRYHEVFVPRDALAAARAVRKMWDAAAAAGFSDWA